MNNNNEKFKLGQLKICVEKHLQKHQDELTKIGDDVVLRAAFLKKFIWPANSALKIAFMETAANSSQNVPRNNYNDLLNAGASDSEIDPLQKVVDTMNVKDSIKKIVNERFVPIVGKGITISFVDNIADSNIRISFDPDGGAWSYIGSQCADPENAGKATMNLGWFDVPTFLHETGHSFGLVHEHNNPNGNTIKWNVPAVYAWAASTQNWDKATTDQNILMTYQVNQINGSVYDPLSIMQYYYPASLTLNGIGSKDNKRFSGYDVEYLSKVYPGGKETPADFYQHVYGENIQDDIALSTKLLHAKPTSYRNIAIGIAILIIIVVIVYLIVK